MLAIIKGKVKI